MPPIHPGEVLFEDFLKPMSVSQARLAKATGVPPRRINEIVHGKRAITANTSLRLAKALGTSAQFWLNLQARHDLEAARDAVGAEIEATVEPIAPTTGVAAA